MLFPRHVTDLYAALFQIERLEDLFHRLVRSLTPLTLPLTDVQGQDRDVGVMAVLPPKLVEGTEDYYRIRDIFLSNLNNEEEANGTKTTTTIRLLEAHTRAKAYRYILLSGRMAPKWLKGRVGTLLTALAISSSSQEDGGGGGGLQAIVDVFVVDASTLPTEEISSASARLGRVLGTAPPTPSSLVKSNTNGNKDDNDIDNGDGGRITYHNSLMKCLVLLLDAQRQPKGDEVDDRFRAAVLTVWAVLEHTPRPIIRDSFLPYLVEGLLPLRSPTNGSTVNRHGDDYGEGAAKSMRNMEVGVAIRRIRTLLTITPPVGSSEAMTYLCRLLRTDYPLVVAISIVEHDEVTDTSTPPPLSAVSLSPPQQYGSLSVLGQLLRVACDNNTTATIISDDDENDSCCMSTNVR